MNELSNGIFTISLDFELYWGMRDKKTIDQYADNIIGARNAIPEMLQIFQHNNIHATWAIVGFLFFKKINELKENIPAVLPCYEKEHLSPYQYIDKCSDLDSRYHFAPELIDLIKKQAGQEIGTHTFSHYYCLEDGQSLAEFKEDIAAAIKIAQNIGINLQSLVFPRNQWNKDYLAVLDELGLQCYRGNEQGWIYKASEEDGQNKFRRALRLIDSYVNISGHNTYSIKDCIREKPFNFPSSRFLRPYSERLSLLDRLKLRRIKKSLLEAATKKQIFHLWWHPHNFGINTKENFDFLLEIITYFSYLKKNYGMLSLNMSEICSISCGDKS